MLLPSLTTEEDVQKIVDYLKTKATGASVDEAKAAVGKKVLDARKINSYVRWGVVTKEEDHIKLTNLGRNLSRATLENKSSIYRQILSSMDPYRSALEWMFHQGFDKVTNVEVAAHWHEHHKGLLGTDKEAAIKDMAVCYFHLCQAAKLGELKFGRRGQPTRLEISKEALGQFIGEAALAPEPKEVVDGGLAEEVHEEEEDQKPIIPPEPVARPRVFISHSKNMEIVEQIKTMLGLGGIEYEIAAEEEATAIPVPEKVLSAMRNCTSAIICITADKKEKRDDGTYGINQNVLIEIGAAFVLYDRKVILVWDKRVDVPSNLQGLYRCEFSGDELSWNEGMNLMEAVSKFRAINAGA